MYSREALTTQWPARTHWARLHGVSKCSCQPSSYDVWLHHTTSPLSPLLWVFSLWMASFSSPDVEKIVFSSWIRSDMTVTTTEVSPSSIEKLESYVESHIWAELFKEQPPEVFKRPVIHQREICCHFSLFPAPKEIPRCMCICVISTLFDGSIQWGWMHRRGRKNNRLITLTIRWLVALGHFVAPDLLYQAGEPSILRKSKVLTWLHKSWRQDDNQSATQFK